MNSQVQTQISYSYPIKVWLLTVFIGPYIATIISFYLSGFDPDQLSFEMFMIALIGGTAVSFPALTLVFSLFCYMVGDIQRAQTLRVTIVLYGIALLLLTWFAVGFTARDLESSYFLLSYLGVMVVAGSLVHIECVEESSQLV